MIDWIVENTVVAIVLGAVVAAAGPLLRLRPAARHALWLVVLIKLVAPPIVAWEDLAPAATEPVRALYTSRIRPVVAAIAADETTAATPATTPTATPATSVNAVDIVAASPPRAPLPWTPILAAVWLTGALGLLGMLARRLLATRRLLRTSREPPAWLADDLSALSLRLGVRPPPLRVIATLSSPCTGGPFRTRILWPSALTDCAQRDALRPVLAHELAHVRRHDIGVARLTVLAALVWWWHPWFWFVAGRVRELAEQASDAWALHVCEDDRRRYADTLLALRADRRVPLAALAVRRRGVAALKRRLRAIMSGAVGGRLPRSALAGATLLLLVALPGWSCAATSTERTEVEPRSHEPEASPFEPGLVGRINGVDTNGVAAVDIRAGATPVAVGTHLRTRLAALTVTSVFGPLLFCRVTPVSQPAPGEPVYLAGQTPWHDQLGLAVVEHVEGGMVAMRLVEGHAPIEDGMALTVRTGDGRTLPLTVPLGWGDHIVAAGKSEDLEPLVAGSACALLRAGQPPAAVAPAKKPLGAPLAPLPAARGETWIADYSDNRVVVLDVDGKERRVLEDMYGAFDAEPLSNGHVLVTEFAVSRVEEIDEHGTSVWSYSDVTNPSAAERLPNGNTLIASTFDDRVIEVDPKGNVVWKVAVKRPSDADRLANGDTLIAMMTDDRVVEVDANGDVQWALVGIAAPHDADRLPNGNTLVTSREDGWLREYDAEGQIVAEIAGLKSPSDAERLDDGSTLVAESGVVERFDRDGNPTWRYETSWPVAVHRH